MGRAQDEFMHLVLGLVGEPGETAEKVKKLVRDPDCQMPVAWRDELLDLARREDDRASDQAARVPYWSPGSRRGRRAPSRGSRCALGGGPAPRWLRALGAAA